jgi:hypothetical protein
MGERTSAVVNFRAAMPQDSLAASAGVMERGKGSQSSRIPEVPLMYQRPYLEFNERKVADRIAQIRCGVLSTEIRSYLESETIRNLPTHLPVYKPSVTHTPEFSVDINALAMVYASASKVTDEQPVANSCPCLPCNLL